MRKAILLTSLAIAACLRLLAQSGNIVDTDIYTGKADITASQSVRLQNGFKAVAGSNVHVYISPAAYNAITYNPSSGGVINTGQPTFSMNYIRKYLLRSEVAAEASITSAQRVETVSYFDGLGRPIQSVTVQGSPSKKDIVEGMAYDRFGRDSIHYLAYSTANSAAGAYVTDPRAGSISFHNNAITGHESTSMPWNKTLYEASPLNRVTGTSGPGAWDNVPTAINYLTNTSTVPHWDTGKNAINFPANSLYITEAIDEDGNKTREYKDKLGQVVRKESWDGTSWLRTAYVYDDFGRLVIVVPPKAASASDAELCYYYTYDARGRMTVKDLPGADPVYLVYDRRDRLVLSQDGVQRAANKWGFTKYDAFNRPVMTGELACPVVKSQSEAAADFANDGSTLYESLSGTLYGYTNQSFPDLYDAAIGATNVNTVTYYDNYDFRTGADYPQGVFDYVSPNQAGGPGAQSAKTKGLVTGTRTRILTAGDAVKNTMLREATYYDDFGRVAESVSDNHLGSKKDVVYNKYNFTGQPEKTVLVHMKDSTAQQTLSTTYSYDHHGRLIAEKVQVNGTTEITAAAMAYNELGEVVAKYLHGDASGNNFNQKLDYTYNVKGWMRTINTPGNLGSDLFALDLRYNTPATGTGLTSLPRYNGNISQMLWDTGTPAGYGFAYDRLNRLTASVYADGTDYTANPNRFNTSYTYDANGNFNTLSRYLDGTQADNLGYNYLVGGNRLQKVTDGGSNLSGYKAVAADYAYDNNGNMTYDPPKGATVWYNQLNLPQQVKFVANDYLRYAYTATGEKLVKVAEGTNAQNNTRIDYSGSFLYENSSLKSTFTPYGRIVPFSNNGSVLYKFEYNLTDHLGNVRVTFTAHSNGKPETNQITGYDPFGFVTKQDNWYATSVLKNKFLYNGKEIQNDVLAGTSLDWYDYGARMYDAALGRWHAVDNKAEKYPATSPYVYALNNPILLLDPDGNEVIVSIAGKNRQSGFDKFMQTASGRAFVAQFLKKGEQIQGYNFTAPSTGKYANSTLRFFAQSNLNGGVIGHAYTLHKGDDGKFGQELLSTRKPVGESDIAKLQQNKSFEIGIALNSNMDRTSDQWAETLGHEVFVHSTDDAATVQSVIEAIKKGVGLDDIRKLIVTLQRRASNADVDHKNLQEGKNENYNKYMDELKKKKKENEK